MALLIARLFLFWGWLWSKVLSFDYGIQTMENQGFLGSQKLWSKVVTENCV